MSDELRTQHKIGKKVNGVVITKVDPSSDAAQKNIKPGNVIVEVDHAPVRTPSDVISKVDAVKSAGEKKAVLLLIDNGKNELRFVALRVPDSE